MLLLQHEEIECSYRRYELPLWCYHLFVVRFAPGLRFILSRRPRQDVP